MVSPVIPTTVSIAFLTLPTVVRADEAANELKLLGLMGSWEIECSSPAKATGIAYKTETDGSASYVEFSRNSSSAFGQEY